MKRKPAHGEPCNNCGQCCLAELCPIGEKIFARVQGPCPALEVDGEGFTCGLVKRPARYAPVRAAIAGEDNLRKAAIWIIGAGVGCDAQLHGEPANEEFRSAMRRDRLKHGRLTALSLRAWGIRQ